MHVHGLVDDGRVEQAERLDIVCVQVHAVEHGVHVDDALVELGPTGQGVGGRVEGTQAELGVPGDGKTSSRPGPVKRAAIGNAGGGAPAGRVKDTLREPDADSR